MPKKATNARPAVLQQPMTTDLRSFARTNVGSFLNAYMMRNGKLMGPTQMLPAFIKFLGRIRSEFKDIPQRDIKT